MDQTSHRMGKQLQLARSLLHGTFRYVFSITVSVVVSIADDCCTVGMTEAEIRLKLAQEDDEEAANGNMSLHEVTPASMIMALLDVEEQQ